MKRYLIPPSLLFVLLLAGTACKKSFLEVVPKGEVIAVSYDDYRQLLNNPDLLNVGADGQIMMGDEVTCADPYYGGLTPREQNLFTWSDQIYQPDEDAAETSGPLTNIYTYNKIINEVMNAPDGTTAQKRMIRAEALAGRAWTNFLLINYFGKPYQQSTAATDPGFPIITTADINANHFTRAPVQEVYDFITGDLLTALPDLSPQVYHRLHMSKPAAQALLGKVYMFMQRYQDALPLLDSALQGLSTAQIPVQLYDYNQTFAPGGAFMPLSLFGPNYPNTSDNQEVVYLRQFSNFHALDNTLEVDSTTMALYKPSDLRLLLYSNTPFPSGDPFPATSQRRTAPIIVPYGVELPELYLLIAECKTRANDLSGAVDALQQLRMNRMPAADAAVPPAVAGDQLQLLNFVMDERLREFAGLGFRWFDLRRFSVDPLFSHPAYTHTLYHTDGTTTTYTLKPERLVLKIPPKILAANPGMDDNP